MTIEKERERKREREREREKMVIRDNAHNQNSHLIS